MSIENWIFNDPPNVAVIANRKIVLEHEWIAYVTHDGGDGAWQFHVNQTEPLKESDAMVVSLQSIVKIDSSVIDLANLPRGWHAWRASTSAVWQRAKMES
jgi:hypothetical protein